jgi:hypothetical protein
MAAFRILFAPRVRGVLRSAYDETPPPSVRAPLTANWSFGSAGRPACSWRAAA